MANKASRRGRGPRASKRGLKSTQRTGLASGRRSVPSFTPVGSPTAALKGFTRPAIAAAPQTRAAGSVAAPSPSGLLTQAVGGVGVSAAAIRQVGAAAVRPSPPLRARKVAARHLQPAVVAARIATSTIGAVRREVRRGRSILRPPVRRPACVTRVWAARPTLAQDGSPATDVT